MNDIQLVKKINSLNKDILTIKDLEKILDIEKSGLRTKISRLVSRQVLQRVGTGLYTAFGKAVIPEEVAPNLYCPSYLSLKTVLSKNGVINQIPSRIFLVTSKKTYKTKILKQELCYRQIAKDLFFGFFLEKNVPTAFIEKALLDLIYFVSLGKDTASWDEMDFSSLDRKRFNKFLKRFPEKTKRLAEKIFLKKRF